MSEPSSSESRQIKTMVPPRPRCWRRWLVHKVCLPAFVLFLLAWAGTYAYLRWQIHVEMEALRQRGVPTSFEECLLSPVPDAENAMVNIARAEQLMPQYGTTLEEIELSVRYHNIFSVQAREEGVRYLVEKHAPFMAEIEKAVAKPKAVYVISPQKVCSGAKGSVFRQANRIFCARAGLAALEENPDVGFEQLHQAIQVNRHLLACPTIWVYQAHIACTSLLMGAANNLVLYSSPPSPKVVRKLAYDFELIDHRDVLRRVVQIERCITLWFLRESLKNAPYRMPEHWRDGPCWIVFPFSFSSSATSPWYESQTLIYPIYRWSGVCQAWEERKILRDYAFWEANITKEIMPFRPESSSSLAYYLFESNVLELSEIYRNLHEATQKDIARRRLASLGLRLLADRLEGKPYPDRIQEDLSDPLQRWRDPFASAPFRLVRRQGFLLLYSIGAERKDPGGPYWVLEKPKGYAVSKKITLPEIHAPFTPQQRQELLGKAEWLCEPNNYPFFALPLFDGDEGYDKDMAALYGWTLTHAD